MQHVFNAMVVLTAAGLGLVGAWLIGAYGALAFATLVLIVAGASDGQWSAATLGGILGAAIGTGLGLMFAWRVLRPRDD